MGRPKTLGDTISFRLPIEVHEHFALRASATGQSVDEYVKAALIRTVETAKARAARTTPPPTAVGGGKPATPPRWKESMKGAKT
jgi:hypothetical protein